MPPMVCFGYTDEDGFVTQRNIDHYRERAEGGAGIIVTEATCVNKDGRVGLSQLGIWSDDHIDGLSRIAEIVKSFGSVSLIQLHHAGIVSPETVTDEPKGPSADPKNPRSGEMTKEEIHAVRDDFIQAALRAKEAGFDGVQLHGAHGYLLSQFASDYYNHRQDEYGGALENRLRLTVEIIEGIRDHCGHSFILDFRLGANSPTLKDGIEIARYLETKPIDMLNVSHAGTLVNLPRPPKDFPYNWICYSGTVIKSKVSLPVAVVNEIRTPERANFLIEHNMADFVNIGRPILADPHWVKKAKQEEEAIISCLNCKPRCKWYTSNSDCPALKIRNDKLTGWNLVGE